MRVRLYCLGTPGTGQVVRLDTFPVNLIQHASGRIEPCLESLEEPLCVLDEDHGNLVLRKHDQQVPACLNAAPIERGGIAPGDVLALGEQRFLVSYERMTTHPLPSRTYEIAAPI